MAAPAAVLFPAPRPSGDDAVSVLPVLFVPEASQWLSASTGRIALDGYSWMQAVHWVAGCGLYQPRRHRSHGPRSFGPTTVRVAQELAQLSPCRPGIAYLVRRTGLSERSVEYHLGMLREAGLLSYIVKGTRVRGESAQASEFARMIPVEFDGALGVRTVQRDVDAPAYTRAVSGIAEAGRELMARLAKKAARKVRKPRSRTSSKASARGACKGAEQRVVAVVSDGTRCTPMQVGTSAVSSAGTTSFPPENKLASGETKSPTPKKSNGKTGGRRKLNLVGRRYQLARELIQELDWLRGCSVPRIAWVVRNVADAGWTVTDVKGWLHLRGEATRVRRGSGLLAVLLAGAETVLNTPEKRAGAIERWHGAQEAARLHRIEQVRAERERHDYGWDTPADTMLKHEMEHAFGQVKDAARRSTAPVLGPADDSPALTNSPLQISDRERNEMRAQARAQFAAGITDLITDTVAALGRDQADLIYGKDLVRRARQLNDFSRSSLTTYKTL
ncbi:winged helix-turn-helix domain-containing protein [Streptomyces sp. NPDC057496]|uniref:helix-turn-helix domain-containing protein n=1 Tax=Streptomyces sp. NPDC057496 TaxID=3346149 RepID=UPI0036926F88